MSKNQILGMVTVLLCCLVQHGLSAQALGQDSKAAQTPSTQPAVDRVQWHQANDLEFSPHLKAPHFENLRKGKDHRGDSLGPGVVQRLGSYRYRVNNYVLHMSMSRDGHLVLAVDALGGLWWYEVTTGRNIHRVNTRDNFTQAALSGKGSYVLAMQGAPRVNKDDLEFNLQMALLDHRGKELDRLPVKAHWRTRIRWTLDERFVAMNDDQGVKVFEITDQRRLKLKHDLEGLVASDLQMSKDDEQLFILSIYPEQSLMSLNLKTGEKTKLLIPDRKAWQEGSEELVVLGAMYVDEENERVFFGTSAARVGEWNLSDAGMKRQIQFKDTRRGVTEIQGTALGDLVVMHGTRNELVAADLSKVIKGYRACVPPQARFADGRIAMTPQSEFIFQQDCMYNRMRVLKLPNYKEIKSADYPRTGLTELHVFPGSHEVWVLANDQYYMFDSITGQMKGKMYTHHVVRQFNIGSVSYDGSLIAHATFSGTVKIYRRGTGDKPRHRRLASMKTREGYIYGTVISKDNRVVVVSGTNGLSFWDIKEKKQLRRYVNTDQRAYGKLSLSHDGRFVAVSRYGFVNVYDMKTYAKVQEIELHQKHYAGLCWMADKQSLGVMTPNVFALYAIPSGERWRQYTYAEKGSIVRSVVLHPDGRWVLRNHDRGFQVLELATGRVVMSRQGEGLRANSVSVSSDGYLAFSAGRDTTAAVWSLNPLDHARNNVRLIKQLSLEESWEKLADEENAAEAYQAIWSMVMTPDETIDFLYQHLKVTPEKSESVPELVQKLDAMEFDVREAAYEALRNLGPSILPSLEALELDALSEEQRWRVRRLKIRLSAGAVENAEHLRLIRVMSALHWIRNDRAEGLMQHLAGGGPSFQTSLASSSLVLMREFRQQQQKADRQWSKWHQRYLQKKESLERRRQQRQEKTEPKPKPKPKPQRQQEPDPRPTTSS